MVVAILLETCECVGTMPTAARHVTVSLVPKPKGGHRPIGLFSGLRRLWARARMSEVTEWEDAHSRPYLACAKGSGALDVVWTQAVKAEARVASGSEAAAGLWDLKSFFDCIDHGLLWARAVQVGFPLVVVSLALASYTAPRSVQLREGKAAPIYPRCGVIAGCALAKSLVAVYYLPVMDAFVARHPRVEVDVYVDDLTLAVSGDSVDGVVATLAAAAHDLFEVITGELQCSIAPGNEAVVASSADLAARARLAIGPFAGKVCSHTPSLGVDFGSGRRRGRLGVGSVKRKRLWAGCRRKRRVATLRRIVGPRVTRHVFSAGVLPAMSYGGEVNGFSDREWRSLQRVAGAAIAGACSGRSLTSTLLLHGDPTWRAAVAPALRWQREIWRASLLDSGDPHMNACAGRVRFRSQDLSDIWNTVAATQHEWHTPEGTARWSATRGPIGATILSLQRIGWTCESACEWRDDIGILRVLSDFSPALFGTFLMASVRRLAERQLAQKVGDSSLDGTRVCLDLSRAFLHEKKHSAKAKHAVTAVVTNSVWTRCRLLVAGDLVPDTCCEICGLQPDTLFHRLWECTNDSVVAGRLLHADQALLRRAKAAGPTSSFFVHGMLPHPCESVPPPANFAFTAERHGQPVPSNLMRLSGKVFADGHASKTGICGLDRASWALVEIALDGLVTAVVRGVVPAGYPQTSQASEFFAGAYAGRLLDGNSVLLDDCANVVQSFARPRRLWCNETFQYAGLMKQILSWDPDARLGSESVLKVKAHVDFTDVGLTQQEAFDAWGNHEADRHADLAEASHPRAPASMWKIVSYQMADMRRVIRVIAEVLPLWPYPSRQFERAPLLSRPPAKQRVPNGRLHQWVLGSKTWHCLVCRGRTNGLVLNPVRRRQACPGLSDRLAPATEWRLGHRLLEFQTATGRFTICATCGHYGSRHARGLASRCAGRRLTRRSNLSWRRVFVRGCHPYTNQPFTGPDSGWCRASDVTPRERTRDQVLRAKVIRLRGKTRPWVAALRGVVARPTLPTAAPPDDAADEELVFGAIDFDGAEVAIASSQPAPSATPLPAATASGAAAQHDSLQARLLYEWRERKRRRVGG